MADIHIQVDVAPAHTIPLLNTEQPQEGKDEEEERVEGSENEDTHLEKTLQRLESYLCLMGFNQSSLLSFGLSWTTFLFTGVVLPVVALELSHCWGCEKYQIKDFELDIVASQAGLATVSLLCLSHNLRKYGIRKFLFVDRYSGQMSRFREEYIRKISDSMRLLILWILPCFILKTVREVIRIRYVHHEAWWQSTAVLLALVLSWSYVTTISLSASILFHLVCNLQVIHFDDYGRLLERDSDVLLFMHEHIRLRHHLSKISHRFRIFLLLEFLVVTTSQFVTLFQTTGYSGIITFINSGDFAVSSIVQVVGIILCLHAATKISHRAQRIVSLASRWHALVSCSSTAGSQLRVSSSMENLEVANTLNSLHSNYSESDMESLEYASLTTNSQLASYVSSYHRRQAFGIHIGLLGYTDANYAVSKSDRRSTFGFCTLRGC